MTHPRRVFLLLACGCLAVGGARMLQTSGAVSSAAQREGGVIDVAVLAGRPVIASLQHGTVSTAAGASFDFPRAVRLEPDGRGGLYVLGLRSNRVGHLTADGRWLAPTEFPKHVSVTALYADEAGVWVAGYDRRRLMPVRRDYFYLPAYRRYRWFLQRTEGDLAAGPALSGGLTSWYDDESWQDESLGAWTIIANGDRVIVLNDLADSVSCLARGDGRRIWRSKTGPWPVGAALVGDLVVTASGHSGVLEAHAIDTGLPVWRLEVGRGLTAITEFGGRILLADWAGDRLISIDPAAPARIAELSLGAAPRALAARAGHLWVGLDSTREAVRFDGSLREQERITFP